MNDPRLRVEIRPRRGALLLGLAGEAAFVAVGYWLSGLIGWSTVALGVAAAIYTTYLLLSGQPRLTLTESGIAWPGGSLHWDEVAALWGLSRRQGLARARFFGIETVGHAKHNRLDQRLLGVDFTVNVTWLEQSTDEIFALVERHSGLNVRRR